MRRLGASVVLILACLLMAWQPAMALTINWADANNGASITCASECVSPESANDGNPGTFARWTDKTPVLIADLGAARWVGSVDLIYQGNPTTVEIDYSTDNMTWIPVVQGWDFPARGSNFDAFAGFASVQASYWRMLALPVAGGWYVGEFQLWNGDAPAITMPPTAPPTAVPTPAPTALPTDTPAPTATPEPLATGVVLVAVGQFTGSALDELRLITWAVVAVGCVLTIAAAALVVGMMRR